jgi:hypothetical protein
MNRRNYNNSWFLDELAKQPTLSAKIRTWLQLEYKIFFEPTTNRPKIPTPLWITYLHLRRTVPAVIKGSILNFASSFAWHLKCYIQFWRLPNTIKGYQFLLSAEKQWHQHYEKIADHKTQQVKDIMEQTVFAYAPTEDMKSIYEEWDLRVPFKYLTEDEAWRVAEADHEDWLGSGGTGDFDHICDEEQEGKKLVGGFNARF